VRFDQRQIFLTEYWVRPSTMIQFATYFISGFCIAWLNLLMRGFPNGSANAVPYFAVIGALLLGAVHFRSGQTKVAAA